MCKNPLDIALLQRDTISGFATDSSAIQLLLWTVVEYLKKLQSSCFRSTFNSYFWDTVSFIVDDGLPQ